MILIVGGLDPSAGAGVMLDARVAAAHEIFSATIVTTATVQSSLGLERHAPLPPEVVAAQLAAVLSDLDVRAIKLGALGSAAVAAAVAAALADHPAPLVLDPVLGATVGAPLLDDPRALAPLLARAALVTPNLAEAAALTGSPAQDLPGMHRAAATLRASGAGAVLVKGGHLDGEPVDIFADAYGSLELGAPRQPGDPRGTGCALATAIACRLGAGAGLREAVLGAKGWLWTEIGLARPMGRAGRPVLLSAEKPIRS